MHLLPREKQRLKRAPTPVSTTQWELIGCMDHPSLGSLLPLENCNPCHSHRISLSRLPPHSYYMAVLRGHRRNWRDWGAATKTSFALLHKSSSFTSTNQACANIHDIYAENFPALFLGPWRCSGPSTALLALGWLLQFQPWDGLCSLSLRWGTG